MNGAKYIGLDVHQATISVAILDSAGKLAYTGLPPICVLATIWTVCPQAGH